VARDIPAGRSAYRPVAPGLEALRDPSCSPCPTRAMPCGQVPAPRLRMATLRGADHALLHALGLDHYTPSVADLLCVGSQLRAASPSRAHETRSTPIRMPAISINCIVLQRLPALQKEANAFGTKRSQVQNLSPRPHVMSRDIVDRCLGTSLPVLATGAAVRRARSSRCRANRSGRRPSG